MNPNDMITLYINSQGTNAPGGKAFSFDSEAFAIADTMQFIAAPIRTICVGQAYGTAAMLLSLGQKGQRYALPNASIMLHQPKARTMGQASDIAIKAKETLINRKMTNELLAQATGRDLEVVEKDTQRAKYLSPDEAIAYGLIDKVLLPDDTIMQVCVWPIEHLFHLNIVSCKVFFYFFYNIRSEGEQGNFSCRSKGSLGSNAHL